MKNEMLGKTVRNTITGVRGVVTGWFESISAEPRVKIESVDSTGRPFETWIDVARVEVVEA